MLVVLVTLIRDRHGYCDKTNSLEVKDDIFNLSASRGALLRLASCPRHWLAKAQLRFLFGAFTESAVSYTFKGPVRSSMAKRVINMQIIQRVCRKMSKWSTVADRMKPEPGANISRKGLLFVRVTARNVERPVFFPSCHKKMVLVVTAALFVLNVCSKIEFYDPDRSV